MRVSDNILPPNGSLNRLSDDQPWQSWGALFSDPDISVQLWMSSFMPVHGSWTTQAGVTSQRQSEPPPLPPLKGNSRHMPGESLHAAAPSQCLVIITIIIIINIIIIIILLITTIIRLDIRIFRHPFSKYPTVRWKWQARASIGPAKRDIGVCANTDRVFSPHDACVWQCIPPNGYLNGLSDEQPWTSWGALFSDPRYLRPALNVQFHAPPQVNSRHMPCASLHAAAPS